MSAKRKSLGVGVHCTCALLVPSTSKYRKATITGSISGMISSSTTNLTITGANSDLTLGEDIGVDDIVVHTDNNLVLGVYTMYVGSAEHHIDDPTQPGAGGPTNTVVDFYDQIVWLGIPGLGPATVLKFY